jgi:hypothetical protein
MLSEREVSAAIGSPAYGPDGEKIGTVEQFYVDDRTGAPTWAAVTTGLFGTRHSIVPAVDAAYVDGGLRLPVTKDAVRTAPHLTGDHLDPSDEADLRRHYGLDTALPATPAVAPRTDPELVPVPDPDTTGTPVVAAAPPPPPPAAPARAVADAGTVPDGGVVADAGMVRSEERLQVGTERVAATRARLVKYVVTEEVQITVPIRREEIRIEEVPLDAADGDDSDEETLVPAGDAASGGLPGEIILHTERPVVTVEVVPVERVRLRTELVQGQETVTEQVQREQIVVDEHAVPGARPA